MASLGDRSIDDSCLGTDPAEATACCQPSRRLRGASPSPAGMGSRSRSSEDRGEDRRLDHRHQDALAGITSLISIAILTLLLTEGRCFAISTRNEHDLDHATERRLDQDASPTLDILRASSWHREADEVGGGHHG